MKNTRHLHSPALLLWPMLALILALSSWTAGAQTAAAGSSGPAASAPLAPKPDAMPISPSAQREAANMPDETRPQGQPVPQLNIPLGKGAAGTAKPTVNNGVSSKKTTGGVNDTAARCEAERDAAAREACRDRAAGIAPKR